MLEEGLSQKYINQQTARFWHEYAAPMKETDGMEERTDIQLFHTTRNYLYISAGTCR
jgi:hypothetical protein